MNKAQLMAFELIQTLVERILEIEDDEDEEVDSFIHESLQELLDRKDEDEEDEPSHCPRVNKAKLPKNWGKVCM